MRKIALIIGAILAACSFSIEAQDISFESDNNEPFLGVRLGLDISCPGNLKVSDFDNNGSTLSTPLFDNGAGFDIGAVYNIPLWKNLYFEPGLSIYYNTMGLDATMVSDSDIEIPGDASVSVRRFGFRIPFQVGYRVDFSQFSLSAFTGPVLSAGIVGRTHATVKYNGMKESESANAYGNDGLLNRCDIGWRIGVGAEFERFVLQLSGTFGMRNMLNGVDGAKYHDNNVALTFGYNFNL